MFFHFNLHLIYILCFLYPIHKVSMYVFLQKFDNLSSYIEIHLELILYSVGKGVSSYFYMWIYNCSTTVWKDDPFSTVLTLSWPHKQMWTILNFTLFCWAYERLYGCLGCHSIIASLNEIVWVVQDYSCFSSLYRLRGPLLFNIRL